MESLGLCLQNRGQILFSSPGKKLLKILKDLKFYLLFGVDHNACQRL